MRQSAMQDTFAADNLPPKEQWPELLVNGDAELNYPEYLNAAVELLSTQIKNGNGDRVAIRWREDNQEKSITYKELDELTNQIAHVYVEDMGLVSGNRILLRGYNSMMMAAIWLAALKAGLITVATMPLLRSVELKKTLDKAEIVAAICEQSLDEELKNCQNPEHTNFSPFLKQTIFYGDKNAENSLEQLLKNKPKEFEAFKSRADDVCLIAFTSGTTGQPKGCMHFHRDVLAMCDTFAKHILKIQPDDIICGTPPLAFTFGLGGMLCFPLRVGASALFIEKLSPALLLQCIQEHKVTYTFTAPTFYRQMAQLVDQYDLSSLRKCISAGEALPDSTRQLWRDATGIEMIDGIGGTEMIHVYISATEEEMRRGAIGKVVPGFIAEVVNENMQPVPNDEIGLLRVKGPVGCRYLADERQLNYVKDGWNLTGDTFTMDDDGYFYYHARRDEMIVSSGYNISALEIEELLSSHPDVKECAVIGIPDSERGQVVKAYVVLKDDSIEDEAEQIKKLQDFVKQSVAPYKYPRRIKFLAQLPRTETGKLQRLKLLERNDGDA